MANNTPFGNSSLTSNLLPGFYQTPGNKKFLQATLDQLYQPGSVKKVNGYIGRKNAKAATGSDIYVTAVETNRQNYQLEPSVVIQDSLNNVTFYKDYIDYINQLGVFGGNTANHSRLNQEEFYSWDPHIDWDKIINFQNYYWIPYGPEPITVFGQQQKVVSTIKVDLVAVGEDNQYVFTPNGFTPNPVLKLYKGQTYTFEINSPGNAFSFKLSRTTGKVDRYLNSGIDTYAVQKGTITWTIANDAPTMIYYQSENDINLGGVIEIYDIDQNTYINVEADVLGKKTYKLTNGTQLSNGMKVNFGGNVTPAKYATGNYYVEGVGTAIKLVPQSVLEIVSPYTVSQTVEFDNTPFDQEPFSDATGYAAVADYIVINRASRDHNPWSRYNRWFHQDVITASAVANGDIPNLNQLARATRPIIEFKADLKLFNFGTVAIDDVDLIDNFTTDAFSTIEGSAGYSIDGISLANNQTILFTADTDTLVTNKIYRVEFIDVKHTGQSKQIHLVEIVTPELNQTVLINQGITNQSLMYWFNGTTWIKSQQKRDTNQTPLFDVVDDNGISYGDTGVYSGSTFKGTAVFSYKVGSGFADKTLGFPLSYKNVSNIGDIVFNFNLATDSFQYKKDTALLIKNINVGYLVGQTYAGNTVYNNGWQTSLVTNTQAAIRIYENSNKTNNFNLDIFDDISNLSDLIVRVYVNGKRVDLSLWQLVDGQLFKKIVLATPIALTDVLTIRAFAAQPINSKGYYEIPINLQNNPLNNSMGDFTLGEVSDHVNSIVDNLETVFVGSFPGRSNLRDLGNTSAYGTKFVQHSGPASLSMYHITSEANNVIRAIEQSRDDYNHFKRIFITTAENLGIDAEPSVMLELIMQKINGNKPKTAPYYFSDMVPYGAKVSTNITVVDYRIKTYPLSTVFTLETLSNKAVGVYLNGLQLIYGRDYTFNNQGFVVMTDSLTMNNGDVITTVEYDNTDGSFVPETPTKLGIYPKYEPQIYLDTTLVAPQLMIQGHDGSQVLAYGDYRDDLILELEKRIFNNIKVEYNPDIFDVHNLIPSYGKTNSYTRDEFNEVLAPNFYRWAKEVGVDFSKPLSYDSNNSFTYNYSKNSAPDKTSLPGYWRGVYRWLLNTDRPNICPWEMLGQTIKPSWWDQMYGPAPYTKDNRVMWQDIADGMLRAPGSPGIYLADYVKPFLMNHIPVDESGNLISPLFSGLALGTIKPSIDFNFVFGDVAPVEASWRRSSHYPFSLLITSALLTPSKTFGVLLDRSRVVKNKANQLIYKDTGLRIRPRDIILPSISSSTTRVQTAGVINYVVNLILNYIFSNNLKSYEGYANDLTTMDIRLSYRVGSFTNQDQFNLLLDSKTPSSKGSVFIPKEDYQVFLNSSSPTKKLTYSGVIVTRLQGGYQVSGYSQTQPYFKYYAYSQPGADINVGGISESFVNWAPNEQYAAGTIIKYNGGFFKALVLTTSGVTFDNTQFVSLPFLPIIGGITANFRKAWDNTQAITVPYGTTFSTQQDVVDFLLGYGEYLKDQGFLFNQFNLNLGIVSNWETSAKEFMFWSTQKWSTGHDKWADWTPNLVVPYGNIVRYNGEYYSALRNVPASDVFEYSYFNKLDGLSVDGASVISLSPAAGNITFVTPLNVVDDINNPFNQYEIFKVNGTAISKADLDSYRKNNTVQYSPRNKDGIYGASFYLVQHEHVVILNNTTIFNDTIYNPESGYRQERIKVSGYITTGWYGGLDIPGFIFDAAKIQNWQQWQDYNLGDIINYQGYYYSANAFLPGKEIFDLTQWTELSKKPTSQIIPNWTNIATQFQDFYGLDVDSFDSAQQKMGQHLIGYQKRQYLDNIIQDDVSEFKFYQGMIREKGTQNVLNKLFDVLSSEHKESLVFYEEWAVRVGQYGAANAYQQIEFVLNEGLVRSNPQGYSLVNQIDKNLNPLITQVLPSDVYVLPNGYDSNPWPVLKKYKPLLLSAGYVNSKDVNLSLGHLSDITSYDPTKYVDGNYIWCAFAPPPYDWNVYRYTLKYAAGSVGSVTSDTRPTPNTITITVATTVTFNIGDCVGIIGTAKINSFYVITATTTNSFTVNLKPNVVFAPFNDLATIEIFYFISQRALNSSIDQLESLNPLTPVVGQLLWTDKISASNTNWASWIYDPVYYSSVINDQALANNHNFGRAIAMNKAGDIAAITASDGQTAIYSKAGIVTDWSRNQLIQTPFISANYSGTPGLGVQGTLTSFNTSGLGLSLTLVSGGSGYLPANGIASYSNVPLIGGTGTDAVANITITNGVVTFVQLVRYNTQYVSGQILTADAKYLGGQSNTPFEVQVSNNCGSGYVPATGTTVYPNVPLKYTTTGTGSGATATVTVANGLVISILLNYGGTNYQVNDHLTVDVSHLGGQNISDFSVLVGSVNKNSRASAATTVAISNDKKWLAIGSPTSGYVATNYKGIYSTPNNTDYIAKAIVTDGTYYYQTTNALLHQYSNVTGITQNQAQGARFNVVVIGTSYTVNVISGGAGYKVGNRITILGSQVGGVDSVNDITIVVQSVAQASISTITWSSVGTPPQTYTSLSGSLVLASGAKFTVKPVLAGYTVTVSGTGTGYLAGDQVLIKGSSVGGLDIINDLLVTLPTPITGFVNGYQIVAPYGISAWKQIPYIPVDITSIANNSSNTNQGVISLYQQSFGNSYSLVDSIVSPSVGLDPSHVTGEQFGSTIAFNTNELYVGAVGYNSGTGRVYKLIYTSNIKASSAYNPIGSSYATLVVTSTTGITVGLVVQGVGFITGQTVTAVLSSTTLELSGSPDSTPSGVLNFVTTSWQYDITYMGATTGSNFGSSINVSNDGLTLAVAASGGSQIGSLTIYKNSGNGFVFSQTISGTTTAFASSISVSDSAQYIAVSDPEASTTGVVKVYPLLATGQYDTTNTYSVNPRSDVVDDFGTKIAFMNDYKTLVVFSTVNSSGRIDIYDRYDTKWVYSETISATSSATDGLGLAFAVGSNQIFAGAPNTTVNSYTYTGVVYNYYKLPNTYTWTIHTNQVPVADVKKIKKAFLYNRATGSLLKYLDVVDPIQGKIPGPAEEEIRYKTFYDPAVYSIGPSNLVVNTTSIWSKKQIGQLWWDLRTAKFINSYDQDIVYRNSTWNQLATNASIDIYEWVSSTLKPSQWDLQADTNAGLASGISGKSLYGDTAYAVTQSYDKISKTFKNTYYFWVKNKTVIPYVAGRNMSAMDVASLIANPRGQDYTYLAITGLSTFSLTNVKGYLTASDVVLSVEYWEIDKTDQNVHTQYKMISNDPNINLPKTIEQKWFDSLCGIDKQGKVVPDPRLPFKLKYGIENRPRQGMFINRFEALKQLIEQANGVMINNQIAELNISSLTSYDKEPTVVAGLYDAILDTDAELPYATIASFSKPNLSPIVTNGQVTGIIINFAGKGYVPSINGLATSPYIEISGSGTGAVVRATINALGQVIGATILSPGNGYDNNTQCSIRNYAVLVHSDSQANNQWSVYTYDPVYKQWSRTLTQSYDVRNYWSYADWYATGYSQFDAPDFVVNNFSELYTIADQISQLRDSGIGILVRVNNNNSGNWTLLERYSSVVSFDWTQSYQTVGIQNGTIQFNKNLYNFSGTNVGYDASIFDVEGFDTVASAELRIILNTIKNNIFIDNLKQEYLNLFFNSVHYVLSEQVYVDWIFKTSFVKAQHNVGALNQPVNYPVDNLANFEDYVAEVKPYRTKVREYVSNYESLDTAQLPITDFDVMPIYENGKVGIIDVTVQHGKLSAGDTAIETYPWKFWLDNVGFIVTEIVLINGGSGYNIPPQVVFTSESGLGATGRAFISNGVVTRVVLLTPGSGYLTTPTITLDGGLRVGGVQARAVAIIGETVIRTTTIGMRFDRVSHTNYITQLQQTQTFSGNGSQLKFPLTWAPDIRVGQSTITVDGIPVLRELYTLSTVASTVNGYTQYSGLLKFAIGNAPADGSVLSVTYLINPAMLNAADRIEFYYEPGTGMLGKDLAQLMTGIDYGGAIVNGLGFNVQTGWGSSPYYKDKWDNFDSSFDDYFVTVAANTHSFTLPYVPANGTEINVYQIKNNIDSYDNRTGTYANQLEFGYNIVDNSPTATTISHINTSGHITTYNPDGSYETTLVVVDASGIFPGMGIIGVGFSSNVAVLTTTGASGDGTTVTLTFDPVSTPPYSIGQTIIVNNVLPVVYDGTYTVTACTTTSVSYLSKATGTKTQAGTIIGSAIHKVASVNLATNTVTLNRAPDSIPSGNLTFTFNFSGSTQLTVTDTTYINVNDIVSCLTISSLIYNSRVTAIIDSQTVAINTILYANINSGVELTFTKTLAQPTDITINANGTAVLNNIVYPTGLPSITVLNITGKISPTRLDDTNYGTINQTNKNAIMSTLVSDGIPDSQVAPGLYQKTFAIPNTYTVLTGDEFIFRRSTSDGSILPNANDYDTSLVGGDLAYGTATGLSADDIIVDGDGMVTPTTSPAPEEVVPGQVVDAVAIKVYDRSNSGAANIQVENFIADGTQNVYTLAQQPNSPKALIVKVGSVIKTEGIDYAVDYRNKKITLTVTPAAHTVVTVFNIGFAGSNILDLDYFVGDGITTEFVTKAPWLKDITSVIYVDGLAANPRIFKTDATYDFANAVGFKFVTPPTAGSLINFIIVSGAQQTFVVTNKEIIPTNGVNLTYSLAYPVGTSLPNESNMIVRVDQTILSGPNDNYFTIGKNRLNYNIDPAKIVPYSATIQNINVIANGITLKLGADYTVDLSGIIITLTKNAYTLYKGTTLLVSITTDESYFYDPIAKTITFTQAYDHTHTVEVTSSYNHSMLDIRRSSIDVTSNISLTPNTVEYYYYKNLASGLIKLDRTILDDGYVWITKNGTLLTPTIDYKLNDDKQSVQLAVLPNKTDRLTFITFGSNVLSPGIAYMQFKDMLNRVSYKRLSLSKRTTLAQDLHLNDTRMVLTDADNFDVPNPTANKPGVIEIRGERIEYFAKNGNTLSRLRRGTLGTGVYKLHKAGAFVQDIGPTETIPYTETTLTEQIISDGTNTVNLSFAPQLYPIKDAKTHEVLAEVPGDIEVFVGGYNDGSAWASGVTYNVGDIVNIGSYTYRCTNAHSSGATFSADSANWTFFIGNIRLKKQGYSVHNVNVNPYSPAGDIALPADFTVDGISKSLTLTNLLNKGTHITVIKQIGTAWDGDKNNPVNILNDNSKIAEFLKVSPGIWYTDYKS
jgi:hypothetical protein